MKITCQSCQAKYTIADEKVLGKVVKIRCKKCAATIVINGNDPAAIASSTSSSFPPDAGAPVEAGQPASGESWTVNVADGDQRTMSAAEIAAGYRAGVVGDDTFCWKDGMNDWLPLREIPELYALASAPAASIAPKPDSAPAKNPTAPRASRAPAPTATAATAATAAATGNGANALAAASASVAPVARRTGGRAPSTDLFGNAVQAGGEEDVLTSAPAGMPQVHEDPQKLTGARNENSVLFSLSALTSKGPSDRPPPVAPANTEASGLLDIRQLSAQLNPQEDAKRKRIDDIMNLGGGGAFSPSLAAPVLSAAPAEEPVLQVASPARPPPKSRALIVAAIGIGAVVIVGAIFGAKSLMGGKDEATGDKATASASAGDTAASPGASTTAPTAGDTASAAASGAGSAPTETPSTTAAATTAAPTHEAPPREPPTVATHEAPPPREVPTHEAPPPQVGSDQPFNMGEAKAKLGSAASAAQGCKKADGPTGTGRVVVTFAPSGAVQSATVSGPPFQGTPVGTCVAARFHAVRVPAFSGSPFSVSKSFSIN